MIKLPRPACPPQDLFDGALVAGSVSDAVASGFRGPLRLTPAVSALKWAYQAMGIMMPPAEDGAPVADDADGSMAEVRLWKGLAGIMHRDCTATHIASELLQKEGALLLAVLHG